MSNYSLFMRVWCLNLVWQERSINMEWWPSKRESLLKFSKKATNEQLDQRKSTKVCVGGWVAAFRLVHYSMVWDQIGERLKSEPAGSQRLFGWWWNQWRCRLGMQATTRNTSIPLYFTHLCIRLFRPNLYVEYQYFCISGSRPAHDICVTGIKCKFTMTVCIYVYHIVYL